MADEGGSTYEYVVVGDRHLHNLQKKLNEQADEGFRLVGFGVNPTGDPRYPAAGLVALMERRKG